MLLVHASKGPSAIHGIGLIARTKIKKGTVIWAFDYDVDHEYGDSFFSVLRSKWAADQIKYYSFFDSYRGCWVCCGDDARFTNHSDNPNAYFDGKITYATKDILPGEEITEDYRLLGAELPIGDFAARK